MKLKMFFSLLIFVLFMGSVSYSSQNESPVGPHFELLQNVKSVVKKCAVMILSADEDHYLVRSFESKCSSLILISEYQAQVFVENNWYTAWIQPSEDSDGGDLDNMTLIDSSGQIVATRKNVPAFDRIVLALTGGDQKLETKVAP